jgi:hypothetical protein
MRTKGMKNMIMDTIYVSKKCVIKSKTIPRIVAIKSIKKEETKKF